eukprot:TRINITY_DN84932_c0_g1_i1.p1 TRINITY_DN84932_c0_g1~~TRINITY_DN84932_c0_g1_i1.p1  ORF type:complete len:208 (+),score=43.86 TRINITY_DN84932_c0_g1_i1:67-690(+)
MAGCIKLALCACVLAADVSLALVVKKGDDAPAAGDAAQKAGQQHPEPQFRSDGTLDFLSAADGSVLQTLAVEVPQTFSKFMEGLMWRKKMSDKQSMLFRWNEDGPRAFWMENTYIGLDIVYINGANQIVSITQGQPLVLDSVPSSEPASYAVEVPQGWCERHGVKLQDTVKFHIDDAAGFVARDARNFGATEDEVQTAIDDGNYQPN